MDASILMVLNFQFANRNWKAKGSVLHTLQGLAKDVFDNVDDTSSPSSRHGETGEASQKDARVYGIWIGGTWIRFLWLIRHQSSLTAKWKSTSI